jgi:hypothetical protein
MLISYQEFYRIEKLTSNYKSSNFKSKFQWNISTCFKLTIKGAFKIIYNYSKRLVIITSYIFINHAQ